MKWQLKLNRLITIQQVTETQDDYGQPVESWSTYKQVWAEIVPKRGREYFSAPERVTAIEVLFRVLYLSGLTTKMRISYNDDYYDIVSIAEIGFREGSEIIAVLNEG